MRNITYTFVFDSESLLTKFQNAGKINPVNISSAMKYKEYSMSVKTVLFDLDGTLLPMDQELFVKTYFKLLAVKHGLAITNKKKRVAGESINGYEGIALM